MKEKIIWNQYKLRFYYAHIEIFANFKKKNL
jgi:hypothetical protein